MPDDESDKLPPGSQNTTGRTKPITVRVDGGGKRAELDVGTIIDQRFVLEKVLGTGGMSVVYRTRDLLKEQAGDPHPFGAIKILGTEFSEDPESWIALQREAKKAQSLAHPRIVTVYDFQIDRDSGLPFVYMEELAGESLDSVLRKNPQGLARPEDAVQILMGIADGLDYAHKHGIVHSDLKPSNVFITEDRQVKILDFGIARAVPGSSRDHFDAARMNALTPAYATCEMFLEEPAHPSDDLYALGVIGYELLTGKHPYAEVEKEKRPALAARKQNLRPARPRALGRRQWAALDACLSLERARRPADAGIFLESFRPPNLWVRYGGMVMLLLCVVLAWALWLRPGDLRPTKDFDELSVQEQQQFREALQNGWEAYRFADYNGALTYFIKAHDIHNHNPEAEEGLDMVVERVLDTDTGDGRQALERKLEQVSVLLSYSAVAERNELVRYRDRLEQELAQ